MIAFKILTPIFEDFPLFPLTPAILGLSKIGAYPQTMLIMAIDFTLPTIEAMVNLEKFNSSSIPFPK